MASSFTSIDTVPRTASSPRNSSSPSASAPSTATAPTAGLSFATTATNVSPNPTVSVDPSASLSPFEPVIATPVTTSSLLASTSTQTVQPTGTAAASSNSNLPTIIIAGSVAAGVVLLILVITTILWSMLWIRKQRDNKRRDQCEQAKLVPLASPTPSRTPMYDEEKEAIALKRFTQPRIAPPTPLTLAPTPNTPVFVSPLQGHGSLYGDSGHPSPVLPQASPRHPRLSLGIRRADTEIHELPSPLPPSLYTNRRASDQLPEHHHYQHDGDHHLEPWETSRREQARRSSGLAELPFSRKSSQRTPATGTRKSSRRSTWATASVWSFDSVVALIDQANKR